MSASEAEQAAAAVVGALAGRRLVVVPADAGDPVEVPPSVMDVLREVLDHLRRGERVRVVPEDVEITTQQAGRSTKTLRKAQALGLY